VLIADAGEPWRQLHSRTCLLQEKSSRGIDRHQSIVVGKVGGNQSSSKAGVTDLQELLPVYMYVLYQYGPRTEFLEGDLGWVLILAIVELIFYIHGEGD
jgi:hypothetical protein